MKPSDFDDSLSRTLASWQITPAKNPNFRPTVIQRIQRRTTWIGYVRTHLAGWSVATALAVVAAGWTGHSVAQAKLESKRDQMVVAYLSELDPRVMAKQ